MKKCKQILTIILATIMLIVGLPMATFATEYKAGDVVLFGFYPQSEVKDEALVAELDEIDANWVSYRYISGDGTDWKDGSAQPSNYMEYKDVFLPNGDIYRAVKFSTYRPYYINYKSDTSTQNTYQDDNGYYIDTVYWFKYEALEWIVLDPQRGLVLCKDIIDSQPFNNTLYALNDGYYMNESGTTYANNYEKSSIRKWLNNNFYFTAFTVDGKDEITMPALENKAYNSAFSQYDSATTYDKVFILTYEDALKTEYGFGTNADISDVNRRASGSDYAKCQGLYVDSSAMTKDNNPAANWWLRSAGNYSFYASSVYFAGNTKYNEGVYCSNIGVRPAMIVDMDAADLIIESTVEPPTVPSTEETTTESSTETSTEPTTEPSTEPTTTITEPTTKPNDEESQKDSGFFGKIKAFFQRIVDFFKGLFKRK